MPELELLNTRGVISLTSEMTLERAVELINANHARKPLRPEDVYVFRMTLSNQEVDTYYTRMGISTLRNYQADFTAGRALLNSHRAGGFGESELPIGRTFQAELSGTPLPDSAPYAATNGASLAVYSYIQRGLRLTDISTSDVIDGIDGGTVNDVSVGFGRGENSQYRCSICGSNLMDWESCRHVPGAKYDNGRAFAWVEGFRGREASLVYKGSTPKAMIDKAIRMAETGELARGEALMLGEEWGVRIFGEKTFTVTKPEQRDSAAAKDNSAEERKGTAVNFEEFLKALRTLDTAQADRIAALEEGQRLDGVLGIIREQRATVDSLQPRAKMGDKWLDDLVDQAVKTRVQAEGDKFDGERYRKTLRATNDPDYIQEEIASWKRAVKAIFGDGKRQTTKIVKPEGLTPAPRSSYRA